MAHFTSLVAGLRSFKKRSKKPEGHKPYYILKVEGDNLKM